MARNQVPMEDRYHLWWSMWIYPRQTIRLIIRKNPQHRVWALSWIYGLSTLLYLSQIYAMGNSLPLWAILLGSFVLGPFFGYLAFSVFSWIILQIGKVFQGKASFLEVRAAMAWSCVPLWVNLILWFFLTAYFGNILYQYFPGGVPLTIAETYVLLSAVGCKITAFVWSLVLFIKSFSEVEEFSVGRAILSFVFSYFLIGIVYYLLWVLISGRG